jgi:glycosyltransferase involved in cell wall biosynthesis
VRVLHVTPSFYPALVYGGPTRSVYQLCLALAEAGCEVRVLTTDANGPDAVLNVATDRETDLGNGLRVRYCHRLMDVSVSPELLRHLIAYVRWADIVHLMAVYSFPTIPVLLAARILGKPVVWSPRGMLQRWDGSSRPLMKTMWEQICRLVLPGQLILHVTSEDEATQSLKRLPGLPIALVPNGVTVPETIAHSPGNGTLRIIYIGRLDPIKGIDNLLAACRIIDDDLGLDYSLKIAGAGATDYVASLKAQIENSNLSGRITLAGNLEGEAKKELFAQADVMVVPSHTENFGLVVAEALAHGVPVIVSRGTPWQRVGEVDCGWWVDNNPESLARALAKAGTMPLREMGERGRDWMRREFTWTYVGDQMLQVYRQLTNDRLLPVKRNVESAIAEDA